MPNDAHLKFYNNFVDLAWKNIECGTLVFPNGVSCKSLLNRCYLGCKWRSEYWDGKYMEIIEISEDGKTCWCEEAEHEL